MSHPLVFEQTPVGLLGGAAELLSQYFEAAMPATANDFFGNPCMPLGIDTSEGEPRLFAWSDAIIASVRKHTKGFDLTTLNPPEGSPVPQGIRLHKRRIGKVLPVSLLFGLTDNLIPLHTALGIMVGVSPKLSGRAVPITANADYFLPIVTETGPRLIQISHVPGKDFKWDIHEQDVQDIPPGKVLLIQS